MAAVALLGLKPGMKVLDLGSGLGNNLALLQQAGLELIATDECSIRVEAARQEIRDHGWLNVKAVNWDDARLPFARQSFDAILCVRSLTSSRTPSRTINEAYRLLKPNGRLVIIDFVPQPDTRCLVSRLIWPLYLLLGCNPNRPWRSQILRMFNVHYEQPRLYEFATLICATPKDAYSEEVMH